MCFLGTFTVSMGAASAAAAEVEQVDNEKRWKELQSQASKQKEK